MSVADITVPYQDHWVRGRPIVRGYRDCAGRYDVIRAELAGLRRPFSVLDLGAHSGYFSFRLAEEFGARCVMVDDNKRLPRLTQANANPLVTLIPRKLGVKEVRALGSFDVILSLSFLHHIRDWRWMLATLRGMARSRLIVETPAPTERLKSAVGRASLLAIDEGMQKLGRRIGSAPGVWDAAESRGIYALPGKPRTLRGTVFTGGGRHRVFARRFAAELGAIVGYAPYPGSLNLRVAGRPVADILGPPAIDFHDVTRPGRGNPGGDYQLWPARIGSLECHAMIPGIRGHGPDSIEVIAPVRLRDVLGLQDVSAVTLEVGA